MVSRASWSPVQPVLLVCALALAGCTGSIGQGTGAGGGKKSGGGDPGDPGAPGNPGDPGSGPGAEKDRACEATDRVDGLPRLTATQFENSVRSVLTRAGLKGFSRPDVRLQDTYVGRFPNNAGGQAVSDLLVGDNYSYVQALGPDLRRGANELAPCGADDGACHEAFIRRMGRLAFRQPMADAEVDRYVSFFGTIKTAFGYDEAVMRTAQALLQSPQFTYMFQNGAVDDKDATTVRLSSFSRASRLSYFLTDDMPDEALLKAAEEGDLGDADQIADHARRLLGTAAGAHAMAEFQMHWLEIGDIGAKSDKAFAKFNDQTAADLQAGTQAFLEDGWQRGQLTELMQSKRVFVNRETAWIYGAQSSRTDGFEAIDVANRHGVLTQGAWLAQRANTTLDSPVFRGLSIREGLLCTTTPPPPDNVNTQVDTSSAEAELGRPLTTREIFDRSHGEPACAACHALFDPLGMAFTRYDAVGQYREEQYGVTLDPSGFFEGFDTLESKYADAHEMIDQMIGSTEFGRCSSTAWLERALGRSVDDGDNCHVDRLARVLKDSDGDLHALAVALIQSEPFAVRRQEVQP